MGQTSNYPDGSQLVSDAFTVRTLSAVLQPLTLGMLGLPVSPTSPLVRIQWPTEGAPFQQAGDDVCYLACLPAGDPYGMIRERVNLAAADPNLLEQWNYTQPWKIKWCFYGPNSYDLARALRSALYQDYFTSALEIENLFPVTDFPEPVRAPENIDGQWFERTDLECEMYEFVTESVLRQTVTSVEVIVEDSGGVIADLTIS